MSTAGLSRARLARMHEVMAGYVDRGEVPGLVTLVSRRGGVHVDVIGAQAFAGSTPMRRDTIFRISSMTKPIIAVATMIPVEECKVRLDEPVDALLPELAERQVLKRLDGPASLTLLKEAKKRGRTVTFDLIAASAETLTNVEPLLPFIDYFMPSIEEARDMSGRSSVEDCARFYLDRGTGCCVFTLGGEGAFYAHKDGTRLTSSAYEVKVMDTTGCGDAFDAGFITALHHKMDVETSLRFAQAAAALVATGLGSDAGILSFDHTMKVMKDWKVKG